MGRLNNFDALRLAGAAMVLLGHAHRLLGRSDEPFFLGYYISTLGVVIFFSISGYLITTSWTRKRDLEAYFAARALRIFPALVVVVLASALVIGPLVTVLPTGEYLRDATTWQYLSNISMRFRDGLPGVFADLPYAGLVNGSLWTLPVEFLCYLAVPLVCLKREVPRLVVLAGLLVVTIWARDLLAPPAEVVVVYGTNLSFATNMWVYFVVGALVATAQARWPQVLRTDVATVLFCVFLACLSLHPAWFVYVAPLTLPYVIVVLGRASTPVVRRASRFGDLSYGLYLWGFPVQQLVLHVLGVERMAVNLPVVVVVTTLLALLSWHLVEKPSLALKDRITRRRGSMPTREQPAAQPKPETEPETAVAQ